MQPLTAFRRAARFVPLLLALALITAPDPARAWSEPGHRIVADIAEARLSPAARRLVREVLGDRRLADVAGWADAQGDRATRAWHYVNVPFEAGRYDAARDCRGGDCVVAAIERSAATLRDGATDLDRADALRWLVHLVGDVHQPLHAGDGHDRGGNDLQIRFAHRRQPVSFHHVWDTEVIHPLLGSRTPREVAAVIAARIRPGEAAAWSATLAPEAWANESAALARALYAELGIEPRPGRSLVLPRGYAREQQARVVARLSAAGVRLAALLDRIAAEREGRVRARR